MHKETIVSEFTRQAASFNASEAANGAQSLDALIELARPAMPERWIDLACGPGVVARALAARVGAVHGVDATPTMVELAGREAARRGLSNTTYSVGDVAALPFPDASFDAAITRFALHHIPVPARVLAEAARVVAPGGAVVIADMAADEDADARAWAQEVERLRDPSHWASLTPQRLRALGAGAGLRLERERSVALELDFDDWLARGSGAGQAALVERALSERPGGTDCLTVLAHGERRALRIRLWMSRWRR